MRGEWSAFIQYNTLEHFSWMGLILGFTVPYEDNNRTYQRRQLRPRVIFVNTVDVA